MGAPFQAQFEKDLSAQREAARPGAVDVRIVDGASAQQGLHVFLDQMRVETVTGTLASVGSVAPGLHKGARSRPPMSPVAD